MVVAGTRHVHRKGREALRDPNEGEKTFHITTHPNDFIAEFDDAVACSAPSHISVAQPNRLPHYRESLKGLYVVASYFFLALLSFSAWPCLAVA